ncbi:MAG TPA: hypothetical protein VLA19_12115 [Herpetosiphonaceae bacterium]|nr:hypothetical protein [Herpetosiphonaceae bacterium]
MAGGLALGERVAREGFPTAREAGDRRGHDWAQFSVAEKALGHVDDPDHLAAGVKVPPPDELVDKGMVLNGWRCGASSSPSYGRRHLLWLPASSAA